MTAKPVPKRYKEHDPVPYKNAALSSVIVENLENTFAKFGGNKYECILVAAARMRDLQRGALPLVPTKSKAAVTALLEIEAGMVNRGYTRQTK